MVGPGQWLVLGGTKSVQEKEDEIKASILGTYRKSTINKKILSLLCLKMPKS